MSMDLELTDTVQLALPREMESLEGLFSFVRTHCARLALDSSLVRRAELVAEELFTNLVKYNPEGKHPIEVIAGTRAGSPQSLVLRFVDRGVHAFDPRSAPRVDTRAPLEQRQPGGLGLHLVLHMVDSLDYHHEAGDSTTTVVLLARRKDAEDRRT